jgi:hypothetical protein
VFPGTDGILMQPTPDRAVADARHQAQALCMSCHIRYAEPRQGQAQSGGQLARECLDLNRALWGEKPEGVPGALSPQGQPFAP